jgi:hypothetical protein
MTALNAQADTHARAYAFALSCYSKTQKSTKLSSMKSCAGRERKRNDRSGFSQGGFVAAFKKTQPRIREECDNCT